MGKQVAEDARKLVAGKLSDINFHQKYHKAYIDEFGIDRRQILSGSLLAKEIPRRTLFKLGGIILATILGTHLSRRIGHATNTKRSTDDDSHIFNTYQDYPPDTNVHMGMVIDLENCNGCLDCVYACHKHNFNPQGVLWLHVLAFQDENSVDRNFLIRRCQHCANPPCVKVCPVRARHKREKDGLVLTDYNLCIGCRYCMVTCPYGVNYFQWDVPKGRNFFHKQLTDYRGKWVVGNPPKGVMGKCTFCADWVDGGKGSVVCESVCIQDVFHFGDMNDPDSRPRQYLTKRKNESKGTLSTFRLLENHGTKPSIIYIGQQPSRSAKIVQGPVSYSDWDLVEQRLPYLEGPKPWFVKMFGGGR